MQYKKKFNVKKMLYLVFCCSLIKLLGEENPKEYWTLVTIVFSPTLKKTVICVYLIMQVSHGFFWIRSSYIQ